MVSRKICTALIAAGLLGALDPLVATADGADGLAGVYRGFLAFDIRGAEVRERLMVVFSADGTVTFGAEEGQDEPVDPESGVVTANDFESTAMGAWRATAEGLEFGVQQFRAGSALCNAIAPDAEGRLPSCSFVLTAALMRDLAVRGSACDLGGLSGGFGVQSVDGSRGETDPLGLGLRFDYCLQRLSVDDFLLQAPLDN